MTSDWAAQEQNERQRRETCHCGKLLAECDCFQSLDDTFDHFEETWKTITPNAER